MGCKIEKVLLNPEQRRQHIERLLAIDGLKPIEEKVNGVYCAVPLTGAPIDKRKFIEDEHEKIKTCIKLSGLEIYDPKDAPGNPWFGLKHRPGELYDADTLQVVTPRFFEFTNIFPSTGSGIEEQKAITYVKISVIIVKDGTYTSRMSTGARRAIILEYKDVEKQQKELSGVFTLLKKYEPGVGICSIHGNTLLGFLEGEVICLPCLIEKQFPALTYNFDKYMTK